MRSGTPSVGAGIGLLCLLSGCYSHYGYNPYGSSGPTSYPMAPSGTYAPGGTYMSPTPSYSPSTPYAPYNGGSPSMGPTPLAPSGGAPSSQPNWNPAPNNSLPVNPARPYEPGAPDRPVPNPTDEQGFGEEPGASVMPPFSPLVSGSGVQLQTIEPGPTFAPGAAAPTGTVVSNDPFAAPMRSVSNGSTVTARPTKFSDAGEGRKPFGYDTRNYTWLRGYIDYDPQDQRWIMIYSSTPESSDRFGGSVTLQDHQLLSRVKPQDHVLIEGDLNQAAFDQHGKPMYRIDKIVRLK